MTFLQTMLSLLYAHIYLVSLISGIFGGEETAIVILTLLIKEKFMILIFFILFQVGNLLMDTLIFFFSTTKMFGFIVKKEFASKAYKQYVYIMNRYGHRNPFVTMLITKFVYGTRVIAIIYMAREKLDYAKFMTYNLITTFIWMSVVTVLGLTIGVGVTAFISKVKNVELGVVLFLVFSFIVYLINRGIKQWLLTKRKKGKK